MLGHILLPCSLQPALSSPQKCWLYQTETANPKGCAVPKVAVSVPGFLPLQQLEEINAAIGRLSSPVTTRARSRKGQSGVWGPEPQSPSSPGSHAWPCDFGHGTSSL